MEKGKKHKIFVTLNTISAIVIVVLLFHHRERFYAMVHPRGKELVQNFAPELAAGSWINSEPLKLSDLKGKVVVLDFWTFDCINCRHVLPVINDWFEKYSNRGVVIIGVHTPETAEEENLSSLQSFIKEWKIKYPVLTDNAYHTWNRYSTQFWPSTVLIDKKGMIREFHVGELGYSSLEEKLQDILHE